MNSTSQKASLEDVRSSLAGFESSLERFVDEQMHSPGLQYEITAEGLKELGNLAGQIREAVRQIDEKDPVSVLKVSELAQEAQWLMTKEVDIHASRGDPRISDDRPHPTMRNLRNSLLDMYQVTESMAPREETIQIMMENAENFFELHGRAEPRIAAKKYQELCENPRLMESKTIYGMDPSWYRDRRNSLEEYQNTLSRERDHVGKLSSLQDLRREASLLAGSDQKGIASKAEKIGELLDTLDVCVKFSDRARQFELDPGFGAQQRDAIMNKMERAITSLSESSRAGNLEAALLRNNAQREIASARRDFSKASKGFEQLHRQWYGKTFVGTQRDLLVDRAGKLAQACKFSPSCDTKLADIERGI